MSAALAMHPPVTGERLRFVRFASLDNWSPSSSTGNLDFHSEIPLRPLADALQAVRHPIIVQEGTQYHRVTVRINGNGVCRRDTVSGSVIKTKRQFRVSAGQFIMSRIDARNGAFGLIPDDLDGAIVTNDFPVFAVRQDRMLSDYLRLVVSTPLFREYCQTLSKGTTNRQRMDEGTFLSIPIPFPTIAEQAKLIAEERSAFLEAEAAESRAREADLQVIRFLEESLGLKPRAEKTKLESTKLHFVRFATLERWDLIAESLIVSSKYKLVNLHDITVSISTGTTPPTQYKEYFGGDVPFFTPADLGENPILVNSSRTLARKAIMDKKARSFIRNTLLFVGIGSSIGKAGVVGVDFATANQQITGLLLDETIANVHFIQAWLVANKDYTTREKAQTTLPIMNQERILRIQIPFPPLPEQKRIVTELDRLRAEARAARTTAAACREAAAKSFHAALFAQ